MEGLMNIFKREKPELKLAGVLGKEEPVVNYNSVLDYLTGLSKADYGKMIKVSEIYRNANEAAAKVIGIKDEPTVPLIEPTPTGDEIEKALDDTLAGNFLDDEPEAPKPKKKQSAAAKKIEIQD
jgi:hypothetical protein